MNLLVLVQLAYVLWVAWRLRRGHPQKAVAPAELPALSVIIAARDAAAHLQQNLPAVLAQDYPKFEVIVVNDRSTDHSARVLAELCAQYKHLRVVSSELSGTDWRKKEAMARGIAEAAHPFLVFTDADCRPVDKQWLVHFGEAFARGHDLVLGAGHFYPENTMVNAIARIESARTAMLYFAAAAAQRPYMAVGRSLGYTKALYLSAGGFAAHAHIPSGDDDLFVLSVRGRARVAIAPEACTLSPAPKTFSAWLAQKKRHMQTGVRYPASALLYLGVYDLTLACSVFMCMSAAWLLPLLLLRVVVFYYVLWRLDKRARLATSHAQLFIFELVLPFVYTLLSVFHANRWRKGTKAIGQSAI